MYLVLVPVPGVLPVVPCCLWETPSIGAALSITSCFRLSSFITYPGFVIRDIKLNAQIRRPMGRRQDSV